MWIDTLENKAMLAAGMAACVVLLARKANGRFPAVVPAAALVIAVTAVAIATSTVTLWGFHGQMHWAFSLATLRSWLPGGLPEDPVFAGQPLMYPWTAHWVYAQIARLVGCTPMAVIAATDVLWLALMVLATGRAAAMLTGKSGSSAIGERRGAAIIAGFLAWTGVLVTDDAYISQMGKLHDAIRPCMRMVPADKFFNPNNNPIGLALGAMAVMCLVRVMTGTGRAWRWLGALAIAAFACATLYPISYVGMVAMIIGGAIGAAIASRKLFDARMIRCGVAVALGGVAALPSMLSFDLGRQPMAKIATTAPGEIAGKCAVIGTVAGLAIVLLLFACRNQRRAAMEPRIAMSRGMLIGASAGLAAAYLALAIPLACEYKLLAQTAAPMACLLAPWFASLARGRWWLAILLLTPLAFGAADRQLIRFYLDRPIPIVVRDGRARAKDPALDEMLTFLRESTPRDAVIIAEEPLVPTIGERSLYLEPASLGVTAWDGWSMGRQKVALQVIGHPTDMFTTREQLQRQLLTARSIDTTRAIAAALRAEFPDRSVYVVATIGPETAILERSTSWKLCRAFATRQVFELRDR